MKKKAVIADISAQIVILRNYLGTTSVSMKRAVSKKNINFPQHVSYEGP